MYLYVYARICAYVFNVILLLLKVMHTHQIVTTDVCWWPALTHTPPLTEGYDNIWSQENQPSIHRCMQQEMAIIRGWPRCQHVPQIRAWLKREVTSHQEISNCSQKPFLSLYVKLWPWHRPRMCMTRDESYPCKYPPVIFYFVHRRLGHRAPNVPWNWVSPKAQLGESVTAGTVPAL